MTSEIWPVGVPYKPLVDQIALESGTKRSGTGMESGRIRKGKLGTKRYSEFVQTVKMTPSQFAIFFEWVTRDLVEGSLRFQMPIWTGLQYENKICSFVPEDNFRAPLDEVGNYHVELHLQVENLK